MSSGIMTGAGGASLDWDRRWRVTPVQTTSQEAWPEAESLGWNTPLGENRGGTPSDERAPKERAPHRKVRRKARVCRRSASFNFFFVARVERSETRERRRSRTFVPGFRCAQSGLQAKLAQGTNERQAPPLTFSYSEPGFAFDITGIVHPRDPLAITRRMKLARARYGWRRRSRTSEEAKPSGMSPTETW
jgi:hypothetical protein